MAFIAMISGTASAQSAATASLTGTVSDASGAVIPGADVTAKNADTGVEFHTVSDSQGVYVLPAMPPGTYTVTISLMGFKKSVHSNVVLNTATESQLKATLEVGGLEEVVTVTGGANIVQTQQTTIAATINSNQISNVPLVSRDVINAITMLPGVDTASTPRNSTVSGLPRGTINITLDGVNTQDNNNKTTEGLFSLISPRLDAIEEVTVTTAASGAEGAGQGAVQIKFVTRSGTNKFQGSAYFYMRDPAWNSNYWFNNRDKTPDPVTGLAPKDVVKLKEPGFRVGGPILKDKAFFFFNFEEFRQPGSVTRQRTILTPLAMSGVFTYNGRQVNLLQLAAANGQTSTLDPIISKVNADITAAVNGQNLTALSDPNELQYTLTNVTNQDRYYPTGRGDYNINQNNRVSFSMNYQKYYSTPDSLNSLDPSFPGFPIIGSQNSIRRTWAVSERATLSPNLVNEVHGGYTNSLVQFFPEISTSAFTSATVGAMGAYSISWNAQGGYGNTLTSPAPSRNTQGRENPTISIDDTLNWLHGSHSVSMGGSFTHIGLHSYSQNVVPSVTPGTPTGDPALGLFTTANFPGASTTNLTAAQSLYSLLTGHVASITSSAVLDENSLQYSYLGNAVARGQMHEFGFFAQDSWRARKNLTLNYGLRYEVQLPFVPRNSVYSTTNNPFGLTGSADNLFKPGVEPGTNTQFVPFPADTKAYNTDWNNFAPSIGMTWRPSARGGFLGKLIGGDEATVIRGAYAIAYNRNGIGDFSGQFGLNTGQTVVTTRSTGNGNLGPVPLLFSINGKTNDAGLAAPAFDATPHYPLTDVFAGNGANTFDPNIKVPYTHSFSFGVQREITKDMAIEVRYVGNRNRAGWTSNVNFNETNINTNGFLDEFRHAQANLQANIAAGKGNTFAYTGVAGTVPLPVYLAAFSGIGGAAANDPTKYTSSNFSSTNFTNALAIYNPSPLTAAGTSGSSGLGGTATFVNNMVAAGYPANYFRANPYLAGGVFVFENAINGKYDSLQVEVRKRLSGGLQIAGNYVLANAYQDAVNSLQEPNELRLTTGTTGGIHQALKFNWVYELPFGAGKKWANRSGVMDRIVGGWGFDGAARIQSGQILSFGNVRLVGMTDAQLQDAFQIRKDDANRIVYILPQDIIDNTIKAFSTSATSATGYGSLGAPTGRYFAPANGPDCIQALPGQCAPLEHFVTGPAFVRVDMSVSKRVQIAKTVNFEFRTEFLNAFNNIDFNPVASASSSATMGQVTSAYTDSSNTQDPGGRLVQLVFRINW